MGEREIAVVRGLLVFGLMLGTVLAIAALNRRLPKKKVPGSTQTKKADQA